VHSGCLETRRFHLQEIFCKQVTWVNINLAVSVDSAVVLNWIFLVNLLFKITNDEGLHLFGVSPARKFLRIQYFLGTEPDSMILHNLIILSLVSLHASSDLILKLAKFLLI